MWQKPNLGALYIWGYVSVSNHVYKVPGCTYLPSTNNSALLIVFLSHVVSISIGNTIFMPEAPTGGKTNQPPI